MRPIQESAWRLEAKWKAPSETLTKTQEDAHREVLAIVEARTVVYRDAVTPYMEESILTLRALIPGSGKLHLSLNTRTGHRARVPHKMQRLFEGGVRVGEAAWLERHACQAQTSQRPTLHPTAPRGCIVLLRTPLGLIITAKTTTMSSVYIPYHVLATLTGPRCD